MLGCVCLLRVYVCVFCRCMLVCLLIGYCTYVCLAMYVRMHACMYVLA